MSQAPRALEVFAPNIIVTGLVNGGVYALLAIGFSLIFGVARIVNIAHTAFYMLAAYCFYTLLTKTGLGFVLSALISVGAVTLLSVLCYRLVIEPVREHEAAVLISTIALALIFQELMLIGFGGHFLGIPSTLERRSALPRRRHSLPAAADPGGRGGMLTLVWFVTAPASVSRYRATNDLKSPT